MTEESISLSWAPKIMPFYIGTSNDSDHLQKILNKASSSQKVELVDGPSVLPRDPRRLKRLLKKQAKDTSGKSWFDMPAPTITPELKKDLQLLKLRNVIDPKRHYKKGDLKSFPKYFQVGTVVESASDFYSGRLTKRERRRSLAEELLSDQRLLEYRKQKVREISEQRRPAGFKKQKRGHDRKHGKGKKF